MITPCIKVCKVAPRTDYCSGCFRSLEEIRTWVYLSEREQADVMEKVKQRHEHLLSLKKSD